MKTTGIIPFSLLLATLLLTTVANAQIEIGSFADGKFTLKKTYTPAPAPQQDISLFISKINKTLKKIRPNSFNNIGLFYIEKQGWHYYDSRATASEEYIVFTEFAKPLFYKDILLDKPLQFAESENGTRLNNIIIPVSGYKIEGKTCTKIVFEFHSLEAEAQDLVENMYYILQPFREKQLALTRADSIQFSIAVAKYHEMAEKPPITEEQRKYIVQANMFNEEKNYAKTIELFNKTLEINPVTYPTAYYNLALLYAQEYDFRQAIFNMKKYLILVPGAPDARAAQDKIYEWEAKQ